VPYTLVYDNDNDNENDSDRKEKKRRRKAIFQRIGLSALMWMQK
jgi:hypothetical protein